MRADIADDRSSGSGELAAVVDARAAGKGDDAERQLAKIPSEFRRGYDDGYFERGCQPTSRQYIEGYERGKVVGRALRKVP